MNKPQKVEKIFLIGGGSFAIEVANYINDINFINNTKLKVTKIIDPSDKNKNKIEKILKYKISYSNKIGRELSNMRACIVLGDSKKREQYRVYCKKKKYRSPNTYTSKFIYFPISKN